MEGITISQYKETDDSKETENHEKKNEIFSLELPYHKQPIPLMINNNYDVKITEDGGISKKILIKPTKESNPLSVGSKAQILYFGIIELENGEQAILEDSRIQPRKFTIGGNSPKFLPFFEECLKSMKEDEVSWFKITPKYSYGSLNGNGKISIAGKSVDVNSNLFYEFRISSMNYKPPIEANTNKEMLNYCKLEREKGKILYKKKSFKESSKIYFNSYHALMGMKFSDELMEKRNKEAETLLLNLASSNFEEKNFDEAIIRLKMYFKNSESSKGYRIYAKCERMKENLDSASEMIKKALKLEPNNPLNQIELKLIEKKIKQHDHEDQKKYQKVLKEIYSSESLYEDVKPKNVLYGSDGSELYF
eukprot:gene3206-5522_t